MGLQQREALIALHNFLIGEQGTIDAMLTLSRAGLGEEALPSLASLLEPAMAGWQREELGETLGELLDAIEAFVDADYAEDWEPATVQRYRLHLLAARQVESALDCVDGPSDSPA
jgi:hypothetical protein